MFICVSDTVAQLHSCALGKVKAVPVTLLMFCDGLAKSYQLTLCLGPVEE